MLAYSRFSIEAVSGAFIALCPLTVALRFIARKRQSDRYELDDWFMLAALCCILPYIACILELVHIGWVGWGNYPFPADQIPIVYHKAIKIIVASDILLHLALSLTKASALLLFRRLFCSSGANRLLNYIITATLVVIGCWMVTYSFLAGFQCGSQLLNAFNGDVAAKYCGLSLKYAESLYISDIILDVWVILMPIPSILGLHTIPRRKMQAIAVFCIALVGVAAGIVRLVVFLDVAIFESVKFTKSEQLDDEIFFYNILELGMIAISINVPIMWGMFSKVSVDIFFKMGRSMTSLVSRSSKGSSNRSRDTNYASASDPRDSETSSTRKIYAGGKGSNEIHALHEYEMDRTGGIPTSQILVNQSYQVSTKGAEDRV